MKKEFIIGVDVSKDKLDLCLVKHGSSDFLEEKVIVNQPSSIQKFFKRIVQKYSISNVLVCLENTGHYGLYLCCVIEEMGIDYTMVPALEIKQSQGMTRGKSDKVDAQRIAIYAWRYADKIKLTKLPSKEVLVIKSLLTTREQYVKISTQLHNSLKSHQIIAGLLDNTTVVDSVKSQLSLIKAEIAKLDDNILQLIKLDSTVNKNFDLLKSIKGIGPLTALALILSSNNFTLIKDGRKFNSYAGIAPFKKESGLSNKGSRVSHLANKRVKTLLHNGACSAVVHDPDLKSYYLRKLEEGKPKMAVLNAVACKLVYRAYAVINRQTPFVNLYQHTFA